MSDIAADDAAALGAAFRSGREQAGLTAAQAAAALHLDQDIVEAIEAGRFERLPGGPYGRGYVGSYARLLKLDADEMTALFDAAGGSAPIESTVRVPLKRRRRMADVAERRLGWLFGGIVIAVLLGAGAVLWMVWRAYDWPFMEDDAAQEAEVAGQPEAPAESTPSPSEAPAAIEVESQPEGAEPQPEEDADPLTDAVEEADEQTTDVPDAPASPPEPAEPATDAAAVTEDAADELDEIVVVDSDEPFLAQVTFTFSGDSWVEVTDGGGQKIHADLGRNGDVVTVPGEPPFELLIGYAPAVQVTYNGDPVALDPHTRDAVARLVVGR